MSDTPDRNGGNQQQHRGRGDAQARQNTDRDKTECFHTKLNVH